VSNEMNKNPKNKKTTTMMIARYAGLWE